MVVTRGQLQREGRSLADLSPQGPAALVEAAAAQDPPASVLAQRDVNSQVNPLSGVGKMSTHDAPAKKLTGDDRPLKRLPETIQATEKLPDGPEPVAIEIEYPARESLVPVDGDVEQVLDSTVGSMASSDWVEVCRALGTLRQLAVHADPDLLESKLSALVPLVIKSVRSLRSAVTKTAILTAGDLFLSLGDKLLPFVNVGGVASPATSLLCSLLLKAASNEKQFVVVEAQTTLQLAAENLRPDDFSSMLLPYIEHKNPKVRARAATVLEMSESRAAALFPSSQNEVAMLAGIPLAKLLAVAGQLVTDNVPEAREAAKKLLEHVRRAFDAVKLTGDVSSVLESAVAEAAARATEEAALGEQPTDWELYCKKILPGSTALAVLKVQRQ